MNVRVVSRSACYAALVVLSAGLTACSTSIDMEAVKKSVSEGVTGQTTLQVASVSCPTESRTAKAGDSFECTVIPQMGGKLTIKVDQQDDKGNVKWEVVKTEGLLDLQLVEQAVVKGLKEQASLDATVSCGGNKFRPSTPGDTFTCHAKGPESEAEVAVTIKDAAGNISWSVGQ